MAINASAQRHQETITTVLSCLYRVIITGATRPPRLLGNLKQPDMIIVRG